VGGELNSALPYLAQFEWCFTRALLVSREIRHPAHPHHNPDDSDAVLQAPPEPRQIAPALRTGRPGGCPYVSLDSPGAPERDWDAGAWPGSSTRSGGSAHGSRQTPCPPPPASAGARRSGRTAAG